LIDAEDCRAETAENLSAVAGRVSHVPSVRIGAKDRAQDIRQLVVDPREKGTFDELL